MYFVASLINWFGINIGPLIKFKIYPPKKKQFVMCAIVFVVWYSVFGPQLFGIHVTRGYQPTIKIIHQ